MHTPAAPQGAAASASDPHIKDENTGSCPAAAPPSPQVLLQDESFPAIHLETQAILRSPCLAYSQPRRTRSNSRDRASRVTNTFSLPHLIQLSCCLQQFQLCLLLLEICIQVRHPLFVLFQPGLFDLAEIQLPFRKLRLFHGHVLLRELQFQPRHLLRGVSLAHSTRLLSDVCGQFCFLVC